jgi:hypothetical protein
MWYKLAITHPVVKMVPGLTFWRQHDDQEITKGTESYFYLENAYKHKIELIKHELMPLTINERQQALNKLNKRFARNLISLVRAGKFERANKIRLGAEISWMQVLKWMHEI